MAEEFSAIAGMHKVCVNGVCIWVPDNQAIFKIDGGKLLISIDGPHADEFAEKLKDSDIFVDGIE